MDDAYVILYIYLLILYIKLSVSMVISYNLFTNNSSHLFLINMCPSTLHNEPPRPKPHLRI
jgi:hypothetical protein